MMQIDISNPMAAAHREGVDTYTPVFEGIELGIECGNPDVTFGNLEKIIKTGRHPVSFHAAHGQVLVIFDTGETYLATGFSYGSMVEEVLRFAEFAHRYGFGRLPTLRRELVGTGVDWVGPFPGIHREQEFEWL